MTDAALRIFPDEYVPSAEGADYHRRWVKANPAEAQRWATFRDALIATGNGAVPVMATKYGRALVAAGKEHMSISRLVGAVTPPYPPGPPAPGGVDPFALPSTPNPQAALPLDPIAPTTVNISATQNVSTAITDTIYNVTGSVGIAVELQAGGSLTRCVVNCNGLVSTMAIHSDAAGVLTDVRVNGSGGNPSKPDYGIGGCSFGGNVYVTRCFNGYRLANSGLSQVAASTITAYDCQHWGFIVESCTNSTFLGTMFADFTGGTTLDPTGTAFQFFDACSNLDFAYIIGNRSSGYGCAIAQRTDNGNLTSGIRVRALSLDGAGGSSGSDPGIAITGNVSGITIDRAVVSNHSLGGTIGEYDFISQVRRMSNVTIGALDVYNSDYAGLRIEHVDTCAVSNLRITNCGTVSPSLISPGALCVGISPHIYGDGNLNTYCTGVQIPNFIQVAGAKVPQYAVYVGTSSTGSIAGSATSWSSAKVQNLAGAGFTVNV